MILWWYVGNFVSVDGSSGMIEESLFIMAEFKVDCVVLKFEMAGAGGMGIEDWSGLDR